MNTETFWQTAYVNAFPAQMDGYTKSRLFYVEMANRFSVFSQSVTEDEQNIYRWDTDGGKIEKLL